MASRGAFNSLVYSLSLVIKQSGGDPTTQKNIFNGNKLPENFIFPK